MSNSPAIRDRLGGLMITGALLAAIPFEFTGASALSYLASACTVGGLSAFAPQVGRSGRLFLAIGGALVVLALALLPAGGAAVLDALARASFIAAFFTALTAIRSAAVTDPAILECGRFLAGQPPGRRYLALTLGGHLFGLVLMYGSISLLGALATESSGREMSDEVRRHRTRRMLVAIQRGFISTLPWSPLAFASAITLTVVPGARWAEAVPYCIVSALVLVGTGWALDTIFKPRLSAPPPARGPAEGQWLVHMRALYILLGVLLVSVAALHFATGVRIFGAVMALVPLISLVWVAVQPEARGHVARTERLRARRFAMRDLPALKGELTLLIMAGFIGTLGAALAAPLAERAGLDLTRLPPAALLLAVFWIIPLTGQLGMNPILAVSLFGPLLPAPEALGLTPAHLVCAITSGWALSGATSPFTASVLLIGRFGDVSATHAGLRWNGPFALTSGALLSGWLVLLTLWA